MEILDQEIFDPAIKQYYSADKGKRLVNFIIDYIVYFSLAMASVFVIAEVVYSTSGEDLFQLLDDESLSVRIYDYLFTAFIMLLYYTTIEYYTKGKSLGKFITKTRAVQRSGENMTFEIALKRSACRLIPFNVFSFLGDLNNGWHDSIPNTKVIDENQPIPISRAKAKVSNGEYDFLNKSEEE